MVCYGPSKGCLKCRQRKIKCDERRPGCRQCEKSKKECPGYDRGEGKISFRNENAALAKQNRKAKGKKQKTWNAKSNDEPVLDLSFGNGNTHSSFIFLQETNGTESPSPIRINYRASVPAGLPQDVEQQSLGFFLCKFANNENRTEEVWGGSLETLPDLLLGASQDSPLMHAATTTAMGAIAWTPGCSGFRGKSVSRYVSSLKSITEALTDPELAGSDNALMAVLMLGFYENIKSLTLQKSAKEAHTRGAAALVKARGPKSFHNKLSLRLYLAVRAQLLAQCIQNCDPTLIEEFTMATQGCIPSDFAPSCIDRLVMLSLGIPSLRQRDAALREEKDYETKRQLAEELLMDARDNENLLSAWQSMVPADLQYTSIPLLHDYTTLMYPHSMDIYHDHAIANTWNIWRINRIHILRIIMHCAEVLDPWQSPMLAPQQNDSALQAIGGLANDICSSVPFNLGHHEKQLDFDLSVDYPHAPGDAKWPDNFAASGAVGGWLMMQPLAFLSRLDCIPDEQRDWVKEYLTTFMRDPRDMRRGPVSPPV